MRDTGKVIVRSPRLSERRRAVLAERRRRRMRAAVTLALVCGLAGGGWALTRTPVFALDRIEITGVPATSEQAILDAAGLRVGQPAIGLDLERAEQRIRALDSVEDARVIRTGTLALRIEVRRRVAAVVARTRVGRVLLDKRGATVGVRPARPLPRVEARTLEDASAAVKPVLSIWRRATASERARFDRFRLTKAGIVADMGTTAIVFGDAEQIGPKIRALRLVLKRVRTESLQPVRIDLRAPARPAIRLT